MNEQTNRVSVDIGGTFTDVVLEIAGERSSTKVLTTKREPEEAVLEGVESLLREKSLSFADLDLFLHGTTLATNAIIERRGAMTALITTDGFRDTIEIGSESRHDQYDIFIKKPQPLVRRRHRFVFEERVAADGSVLKSLPEDRVAELGKTLKAACIESVAISFIHAYANPAHEIRVREILSDIIPDMSFSLSCEVCPEVREYERASTTVANAYIRPIMAGYLGRLKTELARRGLRAPLLLMTSGGGLTTVEQAAAFPIRLVESGPAGGAILASKIAMDCGLNEIVSFDMGGTTAKLCLIDNGTPLKSRSFEVDRTERFLKGSGLPVRIPVIEMVEIGAGGGSIAQVDSLGRLTVGPESASSEPGPASYNRGGDRPTVTDADLVLGRIDPTNFAGGKVGLRRDLAEKALDEHVGGRLALACVVAASAVAAIVEENMSNASRVHAAEHGKDLRRRAMIAFGGAAPMHAAQLARKLGLGKVIVPIGAGVGSAIGFLEAPLAYEVVRSRHSRLADVNDSGVRDLISRMQAEAVSVVEPAANGRPIQLRTSAFLRYVGQGHELEVDFPLDASTNINSARLRRHFEERYSAVFGRFLQSHAIEILTWAVTATARQLSAGTVKAAPSARAKPKPSGWTDFVDFDGTSVKAPVYLRSDLGTGHSIPGPAIITEAETNTVVPARFEARVDRLGHLELTNTAVGIAAAAE
ncbi:hydantoinase/oxoprolinase family protein [Mesorhizobium sp. B2-4-15]|uniref:hydantoinase/oxoprolinase family protein n=1 Tax=Mesorhizobium sp. B2-4-15 TaxID=2589934 RepID=UPI00114F735D|nr:hydantoinase/oxoprolinase family protein [Mesorhizobium sp. B2-4-15]TPK62411.1 hydantoinase/oxoprolinase family protein [Mesorhizobium sp. B2-4-15]